MRKILSLGITKIVPNSVSIQLVSKKKKKDMVLEGRDLVIQYT